MNFRALDIEVLQNIYEEQSRQLQQRLLHGVSWRKVAAQRKKITKLSSIIYQKLNAKGPPPA